MDGGFGALQPLMAPRHVAVIGASDRDGNLGGLCVRFLRKFGFIGEIWPVNAGRDTVAGLKCYPALGDLPAVPDCAVIAVPADSVCAVVRDCVAAGVPSAVVWAGGFSEGGPEGVARQIELEGICRQSGIKLCGPNCIGIINTGIGLTASFSSLMTELDHFTPGHVSIVSQSGGIGVTTHARAQAMGLGFRATISCGNEAALGIPDFMHALVEDDGTRVIAVYTEGIGDTDGFVAALAAARARQKPVVILKGGAGAASARAALAHTGRLAGSDRIYDAIFREFAAIRVHAPEELLDVCLQLALLPVAKLPRGNRVLISTFGGGSGVIATDQCERDGMVVQPLDESTRQGLAPLMSPLASLANPVDMTPGAMTNARLRATLPAVLDTLAATAETDLVLSFGAGFGQLAPALADMLEATTAKAQRPVLVSWLSPPEGITRRLNDAGIMVFEDHSKVIRAAGHIVRYAADLRHRIRRSEDKVAEFPWQNFVAPGESVISEHIVARIMEAAGLPVARGRIATSAADAVAIAADVGLPVVMKGISPAVTHRAAAGLLALGLDSAQAVEAAFGRLSDRASALGVTLDGVWVQRMVSGRTELLVTALRDRDFGVVVGCGMGGGMTEIIDDVAFARAPIAVAGARDLLGRLRTVQRLPHLVTPAQMDLAADFIARFSALVASAPWGEFTFEVNPLLLTGDAAYAVDGLLLVS